MTSTRALRLSLTLWIVCAAGWVAALTFEGLLQNDTIGCELAPGSSVFGTAHWGWLPPGVTCTYVVAGLTVVDGPPMTRLLVPVILLGWCLTALALRRSVSAGAPTASDLTAAGEQESSRP